MADLLREHFQQLPSIGGDVMDLFGNLERLETGNEYHDSLNPNGDPFGSFDNAQQMIEQFASMHPSDLDYIKPRLDEFFGVKAETSEEERPNTYTEALSALQAEIEKRKPKSK